MGVVMVNTQRPSPWFTRLSLALTPRGGHDRIAQDHSASQGRKPAPHPAAWRQGLSLTPQLYRPPHRAVVRTERTPVEP